MRVFVIALSVFAIGGCSTNPECDGVAPCPSDENRCEHNEDCRLLPSTCCGTCGVASATDYLAVNAASHPDLAEELCEDVDVCPDCEPQPAPHISVTCAPYGACEVVDVQVRPLSECTVDEECRARPRDCCECGAATGPENLIAIRADAESDYQALVCPALGSCAECAAVIDTGARCETGRCVLDL